MEQVSSAVTQLDAMTQQNAALVEETASASEEMANQAQELHRMMSKFKVNLETITSGSDNTETVDLKGGLKRNIRDRNTNTNAKVNTIPDLSNDGFEEF